MATSLVTGGAGFMGSHVAQHLLTMGHEVVVLDDLSGGFEENVPPGAEFIEGSILDHELIEIRAALRHFLDGDDVVDGLRMVTNAGDFWLDRGHIAECRQWLGAFGDRVPPERLPVRERIRTLLWTARTRMDDDLISGDPADGSLILPALEQARDLARSLPDEQLELQAKRLQQNIFGSTFFTLTGFHGLHVAIGVIWLLTLLFVSLRGGLKQKDALNLEVAGLYWHFVDIVWIVIFTLVYLVPYKEVASEGGEHAMRLVELARVALGTFF